MNLGYWTGINSSVKELCVIFLSLDAKDIVVTIRQLRIRTAFGMGGGQFEECLLFSILEHFFLLRLACDKL